MEHSSDFDWDSVDYFAHESQEFESAYADDEKSNKPGVSASQTSLSPRTQVGSNAVESSSPKTAQVSSSVIMSALQMEQRCSDISDFLTFLLKSGPASTTGSLSRELPIKVQLDGVLHGYLHALSEALESAVLAPAGSSVRNLAREAVALQLVLVQLLLCPMLYRATLQTRIVSTYESLMQRNRPAGYKKISAEEQETAAAMMADGDTVEIPRSILRLFLHIISTCQQSHALTRQQAKPVTAVTRASESGSATASVVSRIHSQGAYPISVYVSLGEFVREVKTHLLVTHKQRHFAHAQLHRAQERSGQKASVAFSYAMRMFSTGEDKEKGKDKEKKEKGKKKDEI
jgi:hypothetical protein